PVQSPLGIDLADGRQADNLSAGFHGCATPSRLERWRRSPRLRIHRLSIVVSVKNDRVRRAWNFPFTVNGRWRVGSLAFEQLRVQSAPLHHIANEFSVASDICSVGGDVGKREEPGELVKNLSLVRAAVIANRWLR